MARTPSEQQLYDLMLVKFDQAIADAFLEAIQGIRAQADIARLTQAIRDDDIAGAFTALHMQPEAFDPLAESLRTALNDSGTLAVQHMPDAVGPDGEAVVIRFSVRNPRAEQWIAKESSDLITAIVADQQVAIRNALLDGMARGRNPTDTALDIVGRYNRTTGIREGGIVGLTAQQESYVRNARAELESGDPAQMQAYLERAMRDRRYDGVVEKAIAAETPVAEEDIARMEDRYRDRLLKLRGDTIGRTESLTALRAGKYEAYEQGIDASGVPRDNVKRTWRTAGDDRVRDSHAGMDGQEAGFDEPFTSPDGARMLFPGDTSLGAGPEEVINCRCDVEYTADFIGAALKKTGLPDSGPLPPPGEPPPPPAEPTLPPPAPLDEVSQAYADLRAGGLRTGGGDEFVRMQGFYREYGRELRAATHVPPGAVQGFVQGLARLEDAARENPTLQRIVAAVRDVPVFIGRNHTSEHTMASTIGRTLWGDISIIINGDFRSSGQEPEPPFMVALRMSGNQVNATTWEWAYVHEVGHVLDNMTSNQMSSALATTLLAYEAKADPMTAQWNMENWLRDNISPYAAHNVREAWAEFFTMVIGDRAAIPPRLMSMTAFVTQGRPQFGARYIGKGRTPNP